jgi:hypothetical protein
MKPAATATATATAAAAAAAAMLHCAPFHTHLLLLLTLQAFFVKWWQEQTPTVRGLVKQLVASKQLEFVNGGLVQHDEATSHYSAIVEQMGLGMR